MQPQFGILQLIEVLVLMECCSLLCAYTNQHETCTAFYIHDTRNHLFVRYQHQVCIALYKFGMQCIYYN